MHRLFRFLRATVIAVAALALDFSLTAQESFTLDDIVESAEEWANENLDEDALASLQEVDQEKARKLLEQLQQQFQGQYVVDLAALRDTARTVLPLLEAHEATAPYAAWLKARLDYLDVANEFELIIPPPPVEPGQPAKPRPNPPAEKEREIWTRQLADRPWPPQATPYVSKLKPIFTSQKVPGELVWVAEVESSFDPKARSPVGAAGLFQLMPATAQRFGLRRWPLDQRYNAEKSALAAAKYLQVLQKQFKDWRLALAAYNAGEGTVQKLMDRHKASTFDAIAPYLPAETQMYVPKVEATVMKREGLKLTELKVG